MWFSNFSNFVLAIFDWVTALADSDLASAFPTTSLLSNWFETMQNTSPWSEDVQWEFGFSSVIILISYGPLSILAFSYFWIIWPRELIFLYAIKIWYVDYSVYS